MEGYFVNPAHLAEINAGVSAGEFEQFILEIAEAAKADAVKRFINGRIEIARANKTYGGMDVGALGAEAPTILAKDPNRFLKGKPMLKKLKLKYQEKTKNNLVPFSQTQYVACKRLKDLAAKIFAKPA